MLRKSIVDVCYRRYGQDLRAILLTGSVARGEATIIGQNAHWKLLGDADVYLVFRDRLRLPGPVVIESISKEIAALSCDQGLMASVGLSPVYASYFKKLPRRIATFELRMNGQVLWGDEGILTLIPRFAPEDISREDAWRMLANRMIELLEIMPPGGDDEAIQYRTVKLVLDMATSYLLFTGQYEPTYLARAERLRALAEVADSIKTAPFDLPLFADRVSACTRFKVGRQAALPEPRALCCEAIDFAKLLWRWELQHLTGEMGNVTNNELIRKWMARQPASARLRGWVSVLRRSGCLRSWREWPRWARLGWSASPRYWIYLSAIEQLFGSSLSGGSQLPLRSAAVRAKGDVTRQDLIASVLLNYRCFLEGTTA